MDRKTLEQNYQKSIGASLAAELEQNYQRSGIDSLVQSVKKATQYNPSAPSTQPTQAAPAGASSRKQSDTMKQNVDTLKKQRDDALIKAGAYHRAGMKKEEAEQLGIASRIYADSVNAETKYKTQKNIEATEDYDPSKNKFKAGTATLASLQDFGQSFMQGAGVLSHYLGGGEAAYRQAGTSAKNLMDKGVSPKEALETAGVGKKDAAPITDYKTVAELKREKDRASVGTLEGLGLDTAGTLAGMAVPAAASAIDPTHAAGLWLMAVSSLGHKYADAYEKYGNGDLAFALGLGAGAATYTTEQIGGVFGRLGGTKLGQAATKKLMSDAPGIYALATSTGGKWLRDSLEEGLEEGAEDVVNYAIEKALTGESDEMDNIWYDMLLGALAGGVMGSANAATRAVNYNRLGKTLKKSPAAVQQQIEEGLSKGEGTAPAIYAAEVQKKPTPQMLGRLFEANQTFDAESGLSKIQGDITQLSIRELKAMMNNANAIVQAAETLGVKPTPESVMTEVFSKQKEASIRTAQDSVGQAFAPTVDNPANAGEKAYNSALAGVAANQGVAARINNDPAARQAFSQLTGVQFSGNTAQDIAAIEVATQNIAKSGKQAISQAEYAQRVAAAGEQAAAQFDADMQAQAEQMQRESNERWLSVEQNTITDVDGKRRIKEITNTDVRGNTEIGYKKAEILGSKKKAVAEVNNAAKYLGKTIVWFEGAVQVNGQYRLTNGYRAPDGTIYVNINSRDPLMVTFGHEMFHDLVADGKYSGMIDTLVENPDYADMVKGMMNAKTELYERNGIELDPDAAAEEVAADISGDLLGSRDMLEYIGARNTEAATGIKGFLNRILKKLKGKPSAQEAYNRLSESQKALLDGMEGRTEVEEAGKISYSLMREAVEKNNRPFAEQFADYKAGKMKPTELFALGNTSQYLQAAGIGNEPIVMAQSVVAKAQRKAKVDTHGHNLSDNVLLKLPEMLDKPALLLKSDTVPNAAVIVTSTADSDGNPVVVALHLSRSEGFDIVTRVASLYGKENSRDFLAEQMLRGNLLGYSKKEANRLLHRDGLQLPRRNTAVDFDTISVAQDTDAVNNYSMQNSAEDASGKHSLMDIPAMDSTGRELSAEQREYFKDSKVRDEDGNLLVVYHGTDADFTVFDASKGRANMDIQGMFFSPWELDAQGYGSNVSAYYLDIKNPASEAVGYKALNRFKGQNNAGVKAREYLQNLGYDGVNNENEEYIAFEPSQIKRIDNLTPTSSQDIRYSLMDTDSTGRKLSAEQKKFFAGSKVVDGSGNLLVMYHGTTAFGYITEFKRGKKGWLGPGIYLTSKRSDAQRYADAMGEGNGRLYEMYANITKPLVVTDGNPVPGILKAAYGRDSVYKSRSGKQANDPSIVTQADINKLRAKGYDGIVWDYGGSKEVSVFSPEQVKLADNVDPTSSKDIRYSLMEDAQYMADIDRVVSEATEKANDELKAAQAEVKNIRQQLADYRQQATAEAKNTAAWKDGEVKLIADLSEAQSKEKKARALASYMDEYNAISERYRGEVRATDTEALTQYNEKLSNLRSGFRGKMEKLAIEQGAFKRGEKAARDIYVPTSVNGQKVTRGTRTILEASQTPDSMLEEHAKEILAGARGYEVISDKKAQEYAERIIDKEGYDKADELFTNAVNGDQVLDKKTLVLGEYLYMEAAKAGDVKNAMRYAADVAAAATRAGQVVQAMRVLKKATPTGKLYYLNRMVDTMNKNIVDNGGDPIQIDEGLARKLLEAENIKDQKEQGKAVDETIDEIEQNIADQIPATAWDKWNAWRYLSMLGNIRTQVRNIVGNAAFMPLVATKNLLAAGMEKAFIRNGGRTKSAFFTKTNVGKRLMEFGKKDFETVVDEIQGGGKYNQSSSIEEKRTIFKSKAIEGWRKLTNKAMDKGDEIFSKHHYARALAGYLYANHLDYDKITRNTPQAQEVLNKARAYAILEAQKATFRDANQLAAFINKTKRNLLKKAQTAETKGAKVGWYAGTAIAEGIMPFTKTPIDILARGVEYSPIGLIKGIKEAVYDVKKGNKTAAEAIDTLSAGLTGTGIFALGYFLQSLGLLAGALDDDKESKYKKDRGAQGFAIHIGDKYYTIDWLAPFSLPLFTGAAVAETVENGDEVSFATLADVFSTISEPMLEMSMLQGVNSALSNGQYSSDSKIVSFMTNQITGYLSQANPTILGQIARAVDDTSRNAYYYDPNYKGFVQTGKVFGDKQIAKIPFASKALTSRIDLWGNKQENTGGSFFGRLAYNMLSPGYYSEESNDPVDVALTKLYEETEDTAVLPSKPSKTVTNNKTDYKMNAKQYEEYCIVKGQTAHKEIQTFINSAEYKKMSNEDRVDVLEHLYKYSTYKAQKNLLEDKYVASSTYSRCVKAEAYAKGGNPVYKYFLKG